MPLPTHLAVLLDFGALWEALSSHSLRFVARHCTGAGGGEPARARGGELGGGDVGTWRSVHGGTVDQRLHRAKDVEHDHKAASEGPAGRPHGRRLGEKLGTFSPASFQRISNQPEAQQAAQCPVASFGLELACAPFGGTQSDASSFLQVATFTAGGLWLARLYHISRMSSAST